MAKKPKSLDYAKIQSDILNTLINKPEGKAKKYSFSGVYIDKKGFFQMVAVDSRVVYMIPDKYWFLDLPAGYYDTEQSKIISDLYHHTAADAVRSVKVGLREMHDGSIAEKYVTESDIVDEFAYFLAKDLKSFGDCDIWITNQNGACLVTRKEENLNIPLGLIMPIVFTFTEDEVNAMFRKDENNE